MTKEDIDTKVAVIANDVTHIKDTLDNLSKRLEEKYVTKSRYEPVEKIVFGMVGLILTAVIGAVIALVVRGA